MTSSRTYRRALPLETALDEIRRNAGTQFDPRLAEIFLSIGVDRLRAILNDHQTRSLPPIMVSANHIPAAVASAASGLAAPAATTLPPAAPPEARPHAA